MNIHCLRRDKLPPFTLTPHKLASHSGFFIIFSLLWFPLIITFYLLGKFSLTLSSPPRVKCKCTTAFLCKEWFFIQSFGFAVFLHKFTFIGPYMASFDYGPRIYPSIYQGPYRVSINYTPSIKSNDCHRQGVGLIFYADHYLESSGPVKQLSQDYILTGKFSFILNEKLIVPDEEIELSWMI